MAQYIDKSAIVAEIVELDGLNCLEAPTISHNEDYKCGYSHALEEVRDFIDTLEAKDVDLDFTKEVDMWVKDNGDTNGFFNVQDLAKHFYSLGFKARKG